MFLPQKMNLKMARWLNKTILITLSFLFIGLPSFSQEDDVNDLNVRDYKDPQQFEKFNRRRNLVSAWQINELKEGALVVRLKTNKMLIEELTKQGHPDLARQKLLEQYAVNKNTMFAYKENLTFCKVYFIYSNSSDSLLNGIRQGIFLDTNLILDPHIVMNEKFYLLAERDYAYNSSIGFVMEDSARSVKEKGNAVREMAIIIKNKYGHQLKSPFPYYVKEKNFMDAGYNFPIRVSSTANGGISVFFAVNKSYLEDLKTRPEPRYSKATSPETIIIKVKKQYTYEKLSIAVSQLNENLKEYYRKAIKPEMNRINPAFKSFFY